MIKKQYNPEKKPIIMRMAEQPEIILIFILILMCIILNFVNNGFFTPANFKPISRGITIEGFTLMGMTFLLISGVFDISVGSVMALSGFVFTALAAAGINVYIAILAALLVGAAIGVINGLVVTRLEVNPFIATLATMTVVRGIVLAMSQGRPVRVSTPEFNQFSTSEIFGIPTMFIVFFLILLLVDYVLRHVRWFRQLYFIGGNANSAELTGIDVRKVRLVCYICTAALAALSGVLASSRLRSRRSQCVCGLGDETDRCMCYRRMFPQWWERYHAWGYSWADISLSSGQRACDAGC